MTTTADRPSSTVAPQPSADRIARHDDGGRVAREAPAPQRRRRQG